MKLPLTQHRSSPIQQMASVWLPRFSHFGASLIMAVLVQVASSQAQITISASDLFHDPGLYYRAYANHYDPLDISGGTAYIVPSDLVGSAGPDQFWDFSKGPQDKVLRFDYLNASEVPQSLDFPQAKLAEQMTDETEGGQQWLFFEFIPGVGRKIYGFYAENPLFTPSNLFDPPIVDFPNSMSYLQEWTTSTVYENTISFEDPDPEEGGFFELRQRTTLTSNFKADAYGTIVLPDEIGTFGPGLRVNEEVTIDIAIDFGEGTFDHIETDYTRNYYWLMTGYGIVAQLNSTQASSPPPENFSRAVAFLRLFETNKKPLTGGGCPEAEPVTDLRIRLSNGLILLSWTKANCASRYKVQYSSDNLQTWIDLGLPTENNFWQGENTSKGQSRFYRVISIK